MWFLQQNSYSRVLIEPNFTAIQLNSFPFCNIFSSFWSIDNMNNIFVIFCRFFNKLLISNSALFSRWCNDCPLRKIGISFHSIWVNRFDQMWQICKTNSPNEVQNSFNQDLVSEFQLKVNFLHAKTIKS